MLLVPILLLDLVPFIISQAISATLEENNLDDSITQVFNQCKCVIFYLCDDQNFIIPEPELVHNKVSNNYHNLKTVKRLRCSNEFFYCCKKRNATQRPVYEHSTPPITTLRFLDTETRQCGFQQLSSRTLIGKFPWMVSISQRQRFSSQIKFKCGGTLIHPKVVLTAQHCIVSATASSLKITANSLTISPNKNAITASVSKIIKHERYYSGGLYNDIALLVLDSPIPGLTPICLPQSNQNFDDRRCVAVGWGNTVQQKSSDVLREVDLPVVERQRCENFLRRTVLGRNFELHSSFVCAGGEEGKDTCRGDGGGPLMCLDGDRYVQLGIVSWGLRCGWKDVPSLYANVAGFRDWIDNKLNEENITV